MLIKDADCSIIRVLVELDWQALDQLIETLQADKVVIS